MDITYASCVRKAAACLEQGDVTTAQGWQNLAELVGRDGSVTEEGK